MSVPGSHTVIKGIFSSEDINTSIDSQPYPFSVGDAVYVGNHSDRVGVIAFIGNTQFAQGEWIGINLNAPNGKNDGSVDNVRYFQCEPRHGLFTRRSFIRPVSEIAAKMARRVSEASTGTMPSSPALEGSTGRIVGTFQIGDRVQVSGSRVGTIRFMGPTDFATGQWVGIELDDPLGKNDGSVRGRRYFTCKPNHGLFSAPSKITPFTGKNLTRPLRRAGSRESLLSMGSNFSSVSRQRNKPSTLIRRATPGQESFGDPNLHTLESVVKEKEAHIEQLMQEFEMERTELAKVTTEREMFEIEAAEQRSLIGQLQGQIEELQVAALHLSEENSKLKERVHEELKKSEELQFRLEEEAIEKTTLENQKSDVEERIFELEEALAAAKETNDRMEKELSEKNTRSLAAAPATDGSLPEVAPLAAAEARIAELEATLIQMQEEQLNTRAQGQVSAKDTEIQNLQNQLLSLQDSLLKAEHKLAEKDSMLNDELETAKKAEEKLAHSLNQQKALLSTEEERSKNELVTTLVSQLAQAEGELVTMHDKVGELEKQIAVLKGNKSDTAHMEEADSSNFLHSLHSDVLLDELETRIAKEKEVVSDASNKWAKRLLDLAEELRRLKGLERESDQATTEALQQMSIKLLEAEAELAEKESASLEQMAALTESQLCLQRTQEASPAQTLVIEELRKRLEVLETERCRLATTLCDRQREVLLLQETLNQKGAETETYAQNVARLEKELNITVAEKIRKMDEIKAAISSGEGSGLTDEELIQRVAYLKLHNEELERQYTAFEARIESLTSQHSQVEEEYQALNKSVTSLPSVDEQVSAMQRALDEANHRVEMAERSSANALQQIESKNLELQSLQERLLKLAKDHEEFQDKQIQIVTSLETEKRIYMERVKRAEKRVERFEKEAQAKLSPNSASPPLSNGRGTLQASAAAPATYDSYDSQVNFLNSIIIDLHSKNAELEQRLRDAIASPSGTGARTGDASGVKEEPKKSTAKIRYWCDNCEVFDLHDTEQCPHESAVVRHNVVHKLARLVGLSGDRVYCENCGVFDQHATAECAEDPQETF